MRPRVVPSCPVTVVQTRRLKRLSIDTAWGIGLRPASNRRGPCWSVWSRYSLPRTGETCGANTNVAHGTRGAPIVSRLPLPTWGAARLSPRCARYFCRRGPRQATPGRVPHEPSRPQSHNFEDIPLRLDRGCRARDAPIADAAWSARTPIRLLQCACILRFPALTGPGAGRSTLARGTPRKRGEPATL